MDKIQKIYEKSIIEVRTLYAGYNLMDNILDEITIEELQTIVHSNVKDINYKTIMKEFDTLLKSKIADAKAIAKKVIPELANEFAFQGKK